MLRTSAVGAVADDVERGRVVNAKRYLPEVSSKPQFSHHVRAEDGFLHRQFRSHQLGFHRGHACQARFEAHGGSGHHDKMTRRRLSVIRLAALVCVRKHGELEASFRVFYFEVRGPSEVPQRVLCCAHVDFRGLGHLHELAGTHCT